MQLERRECEGGLDAPGTPRACSEHRFRRRYCPQDVALQRSVVLTVVQAWFQSWQCLDSTNGAATGRKAAGTCSSPANWLRRILTCHLLPAMIALAIRPLRWRLRRNVRQPGRISTAQWLAGGVEFREGGLAGTTGQGLLVARLRLASWVASQTGPGFGLFSDANRMRFACAWHALRIILRPYCIPK